MKEQIPIAVIIGYTILTSSIFAAKVEMTATPAMPFAQTRKALRALRQKTESDLFQRIQIPRTGVKNFVENVDDIGRWIIDINYNEELLKERSNIIPEYKELRSLDGSLAGADQWIENSIQKSGYKIDLETLKIDFYEPLYRKEWHNYLRKAIALPADKVCINILLDAFTEKRNLLTNANLKNFLEKQFDDLAALEAAKWEKGKKTIFGPISGKKVFFTNQAKTFELILDNLIFAMHKISTNKDLLEKQVPQTLAEPAKIETDLFTKIKKQATSVEKFCKKFDDVAGWIIDINYKKELNALRSKTEKRNYIDQALALSSAEACIRILLKAFKEKQEDLALLQKSLREQIENLQTSQTKIIDDAIEKKQAPPLSAFILIGNNNFFINQFITFKHIIDNLLCAMVATRAKINLKREKNVTFKMTDDTSITLLEDGKKIGLLDFKTMEFEKEEEVAVEPPISAQSRHLNQPATIQDVIASLHRKEDGTEEEEEEEEEEATPSAILTPYTQPLPPPPPPPPASDNLPILKHNPFAQMGKTELENTKQKLQNELERINKAIIIWQSQLDSAAKTENLKKYQGQQQQIEAELKKIPHKDLLEQL